MDSSTNDVAHDFSPYFRVHKDGSIERFHAPQFAPPSDDPITGIRSKDVVISPETGIYVRLFLPKITDPTRKLPLLLHIHGGAFCVGSPSNPTFHNFLSSLAAESNAVVASVDYRLAPEHPLPIAYDDSWTAFQWVISHAQGTGPEPWLNDHADFQRLFLGGESAGANIANDVAIRAGVTYFQKDGTVDESPTTLKSGQIYAVSCKIVGLLLVHPYFGGKEVDNLYKFLCPNSSGQHDDPRLNPAIDPRLSSLSCEKVLFCLAEKDRLRETGLAYYEALKKSAWGGEVEIMETEGEGHGFHLINPTCEKVKPLMTRLASFLNGS
ncbi:unnamed protein product [Ilex paraguariensis]|uniref:Alpha/beta hydrolase fold-3 domain-containing protein n=1 Tax=Ilex paraguariensis TaxID=185542 RepID=A0ABC8SR97_9AQUA